MVTLWRFNAGMIHHSFLSNGTSITADVYCEEPGTMMERLANLRPALVNRSSAVGLFDQTRSHAAQRTGPELQELEFEVLRHPSYWPELALIDFYSFQRLKNFFIGKIINT